MKEKTVILGLRQNWQQFSLLVLVNAFVGSMIGMERSIFARFALEVFGIASNTAILSFITAFGISKAVANYYTGKFANRYGRKKILVLGWLLAIPVPFILIYADLWAWIIVANVLLGISQGFTWSSTVVMKIDLVGPNERGLAMGLNEFAGYLAVGLTAFLTSYIATVYGITPYPFYLGIVVAFVGLLLSVFLVKDTHNFVQKEHRSAQTSNLSNVFWQTTYKHPVLGSVTQAGLVNNLNDGMIWGLFPIILLSYQFSNGSVGLLTAVYPMVWGIGQLFTGKMSDHYSKKGMLFWGMLMQGLAIVLIPLSMNFYLLFGLCVVLGFGTAMVYPTFLSLISQTVSPMQRAESIGIFRLWRDLGYAFGAIFSGILADIFGLGTAIISVGVLTIFSALVIQKRIKEV